MAGVKGKSGGARPNSGGARKNSGGARPGAGRPKKEAKPASPLPAADTPLEFLKVVMNDPAQDPKLRLRAAIAAAQYVHVKKGDGGKKDEQGDKAKKASGGKFAPAAPPKLVVNNGRSG